MEKIERILLLVLWLVVTIGISASMAFAQEQVGGFNPQPTKCPDVQVTCNCATVQWVGEWRMNISGVWRCGVVDETPNGFHMTEPGGVPKFYPARLLNKLVFAEEGCGSAVE